MSVIVRNLMERMSKFNEVVQTIVKVDEMRLAKNACGGKTERRRIQGIKEDVSQKYFSI